MGGLRCRTCTPSCPIDVLRHDSAYERPRWPQPSLELADASGNMGFRRRWPGRRGSRFGRRLPRHPSHREWCFTWPIVVCASQNERVRVRSDFVMLTRWTIYDRMASYRGSCASSELQPEGCEVGLRSIAAKAARRSFRPSGDSNLPTSFDPHSGQILKPGAMYGERWVI